MVMKILSIPLKTRRRIENLSTLSRHPVNVPNKVRTTTILLIKPREILRILFCVCKETVFDAVIPSLTAKLVPPLKSLLHYIFTLAKRTAYFLSELLVEGVIDIAVR
jgi:hypothetical protein